MQGHGTVVDLTGSDWIHGSGELSLSYGSEANNSGSSPYADTGSYEYTYAGLDIMSSGVPTLESESQVGILY